MVTRAERVLVAYAVFGERIQSGDMYDGLWDFLRPLASERAGERFIPEEATKWLSDMYTLHMPVIVMESLAERMVAAEILEKRAATAGAAIYTYKAQTYLPALSSGALADQIANALTSFISFAKNIHTLANFSDDHLEEAFFDRLLNVDSLQILSQRDGQVPLKASASTLTLHRAEPPAQASEAAHLDYVFGRYLLELHDSSRSQFETLARIADASLVAEALTTYRDPPRRGEALDQLEIYLDGPLCLDVLRVNVGREEFGQEFLSLLKSSGAQLFAFHHTVDEVERVLEARRSSALPGPAHVSERSVEPPAIRDRVRALAGFAEVQLEKLGIHVVDGSMSVPAPVRARIGAAEEQAIRQQLRNQNADALETDVRTVCELMRLRSTRPETTKVSQAGPTLVTRNTSLCQVANANWRRCLEAGGRVSAGVAKRAAPIAITERRICGIAWITSGGNLGDISKRRLVANCAAAISSRKDVITGVLNILQVKSPADQDVFRAVIADQRAERALMDATLGDFRVVNDENVLALLQSLKEATAVDVAKRKDEEIAGLRREHEAELAELQEKRNAAAQEAANAQFKLNLLEDEERRRSEAERASYLQTLERAMELATKVRKILPVAVAVAISGVVLVIQVTIDSLGEKHFPNWKVWLSPATGLLAGILLAWDVPDVLFGGWRERVLIKIVRWKCKSQVPDAWLEKASLDFRAGRVSLPTIV